MHFRVALKLALFAVAASAIAPAAASQGVPSQQQRTARSTAPPQAQATTVARPPLTAYRAMLAKRPIPALVVPGRPTNETVRAFLDRAEISTVAEREQVRALIRQSANSSEVARALAGEIAENRERDYSRTLTALSVLGELRHPVGVTTLRDFVRLPLPTEGRVIEGQIVERVTLEQLQMKAVDGLAYARTETADAAVLRVIAQHDSRAVRAEAIGAYLFNHGSSAAARRTLLAVAQPADRIFLDRPNALPGSTAAVFNPQLARYLRLHPILQPPKPAHFIKLQAQYRTILAHDREKEANAVKLRRPAPPAAEVQR